jgi:predicted translin family RNA/ssDNA-binding protein
MIDKNIFPQLKKEIEAYDNTREELIVESRPILQESKKAIYSIHRGDLKKAKQKIDGAKKQLEKLKKKAKNPSTFTGAYDNALQEYVEAVTYYYFVEENRLIGNKELYIDAENYLLGVCDLTGELGRRAVFSVVNEDYEKIPKIKANRFFRSSTVLP